MAPEPDLQSQRLAATVAEVSERVALLVREEIELAKAEMWQKGRRLLRGVAVGAVAGVFVLAAMAIALHGFAWLLWYVLPTGSNDPDYFWGFFAMAAILLILAAVAGYLAFRFLRAGSPPAPTMAIEEAKRIRKTVTGSDVERRSDV